jgi:hypothetical protein
MNQGSLLEFRRRVLKQQIADHLDLLIGSVHKAPSQRGYHLTTKASGKSVTKYVRRDLASLAKGMTQNHLQVRKLLRQLSEVNWRWLNIQSSTAA